MSASGVHPNLGVSVTRVNIGVSRTGIVTSVEQKELSTMWTGENFARSVRWKRSKW